MLGLKVLKVSGVSVQPSRRQKKTAGQIEIETDEVSYKKANIEYRIMNVEGRYTVYFKTAERSETILRNSAVRYSIFCGSLFNPGHRSG
jgi:hypothetical protein